MAKKFSMVPTGPTVPFSRGMRIRPENVTQENLTTMKHMIPDMHVALEMPKKYHFKLFKKPQGQM